MTNNPVQDVWHGDALAVLRELPDNSVDAIVTDPPAGISFMGKEWDGHRGGRDEWEAWLAEIMREALRVIKPGGHALVWALPRTSHWTATACEDAGWELRDRLQHWFGSGFPKGSDVSKAIDKAAGAEREVVGTKVSRLPGGSTYADDEWSRAARTPTPVDITAPATPEAAQWTGWNTALKPSCEDWHLLRAPLSEKSVAANVLKHGTGALNIGATRVGNGTRINGPASGGYMEGWGTDAEPTVAAGRWPAHLLISHGPGCRETGETRKVKSPYRPEALMTGSPPGGVLVGSVDGSLNAMQSPSYGDPDGTETIPVWSCEPGCVVAELDVQSGTSTSPPVGSVAKTRGGQTIGTFDHAGRPPSPNGHGDAGGASRFFPTFKYQPKAPSRERPEGPDGTKHPTVKPLELTRWLVRLVTPPGGVVLDLFAGSGTTLEAAALEGFGFIGIESEASYLPLIEARLLRVGIEV